MNSNEHNRGSVRKIFIVIQANMCYNFNIIYRDKNLEKIMEFQIISKQDNIPPFGSQAIKVQQIEYFDPPYKAYRGTEITEKIIAEVLKEISDGINIYLYLDPDGEDNWLEVNCDGEWIVLGFSGEFGQNNYYSSQLQILN